MHRRLSQAFRSTSGAGPSSSSSILEKVDDDDESKVSTVCREEPVIRTEPSYKVKRVDYYYSRWHKYYKYRNTNAKIRVETLPVIQSSTNEQWKEFSFVIVRTLPQNDTGAITFKVVIKSEYILKACKDVIRSWPGISWNSDPLELDPEIFVTFHQEFLQYAAELRGREKKGEQDLWLLKSIQVLNETIASDYKNTLSTARRLTAHNEISFDLLYTILVPRSIMVTRCSITGKPRLFQLASWQRIGVEGKSIIQLNLEGIDLVDRPLSHSVVVGRIQATVALRYFRGVVKIDSLDAYPLKFHPDSEGLRVSTIERAKKWVGLIGVHHMQYDGLAAIKGGLDRIVRHSVRSRIMVDRATFRRLNANYTLPTPVPPRVENDGESMFDANGQSIQYDQRGIPVPVPGAVIQSDLVQTQSADDTAEVELKEEDLLLAPTVVFGFSLVDKIWLEFDVDRIQDVDWNDDAFANLVLPTDRKDLLRSLVEAHHRGIGFDDFIKGKGHGLVVNLFGPPGVGKTFSAEATSEHVRRPLYVVGAGDLGTTASLLDSKLEAIFDVATAWKAIVLIDEADVFLEQRSLHDLERNAMVAVFLRHVEYYRGILFLTTNRVRTFDDAFLSRIHVALHFTHLSEESKEMVWRAFLGKAGGAATVAGGGTGVGSITSEEIRILAKRNVNGRQIKNAVRTAASLAASRDEELQFGHLVKTLDAMDEFTLEMDTRQ